MPAPGGPSNNSGVGYQNSIVSLFLGRLLDPTRRDSRDRVLEVRGETVGPIDDVELTFADGSRKWLQAKEQVSPSSDEWRDMWRACDTRRRDQSFKEVDRLYLWFGGATRAQAALFEAANRATNARDALEWSADLSKTQREAVEDLHGKLSSEPFDWTVMHSLLRVVETEVVSNEQLRRDWLPRWMPHSEEVGATSLFEVLKSKAIEAARYRRPYVASTLAAELRDQGIAIADVAAGVSTYRAALLAQTGTMKIPGTSISGPTTEVFLWPRIRSWVNDVRRVKIDEDVFEQVGEAVDPRSLPEGPGARAVILGGAGLGKSAFLGALAHRLCDSSWLPAIVPLVELVGCGGAPITFLAQVLNRRYAVSLDWTEQCERGTALLLFDGLDELSVAARAAALEAIQVFASRFPRTPWILAVRDMTGTATPTGARTFELQPLDGGDVEEFCRRWLRSAEAASRLSRTISASRELRRMARIPLLLALMAEYASRNGTALPSRRGDLLEEYVTMMLRPAKHKPSMVVTDPLALRTCAEHMAFAGVEGGGEIAARDAAAYLPKNAQEVLDSLVACGLLVEQWARYRFVYPLIQEYLAGCFVATNRRDTIVSTFEGSLSRPWTQTLQFAIERCDNADAFANPILRGKDDAFFTRLKSLGRCIANGAHVSAGVRARVGDALAGLWIQEDRTGNYLGELLADGFMKPLPTLVRTQVASGRQLEFGGAAILVAADDGELTRQALAATLSVGFPGHVFSWQTAIDRIAPVAASMYLARAKAIQTEFAEREAQWLAYLLGAIAPVAEPSDPRIAAAADPSVHPILRLACLVRLGTPLSPEAERLVEAGLRGSWATDAPNRSPPLDLIFKALFLLPDSVTVWRRLVVGVETATIWAWPDAWWLFGFSRHEPYWRTLVFSIVTNMQREALPHLRMLAQEVGAGGTRRDYVDLCLAFLGDADAFNELAERLETLHQRDIVSWLILVRKHSRDVVATGLSHLAKTREKDRMEIHSILCFALRYELEINDLTGGARGLSRALHPAASIGASVLREWAEHSPHGSSQRLRFLSGAVQLGDRPAIAALEAEMLAMLNGTSASWDFDTDGALGESLSALAEVGRQCELAVLLRAARASIWNLSHRAIDQIEARGTREALKCLIAVYNERNAQARGILKPQVERLALSLGVRVDGTENGEFVIAAEA